MMLILTLVKFKKGAVMKKYLFAVSAALLSLAACNKEIEIGNPVKNDYDTDALTFTSQRPQLAPVTATSWDGSAIVWTADVDKIKVGFTFDDNWWGQTDVYGSESASPNNHKKFYQSDAVDIDGSNASVGTFSVPATFTGPAGTGDFVFYAVYPSTAMSENSQDGAPTVSVTLKSTQTPLFNSFDGSADLMVGKSATINSTGLPTDPIGLNWTRVVAHGLFTLKDFQNVVGGETIEKVVFTAQDGANLTGKQSVNIADGTVTASDASNKITLEGTNLAFVTEETKTNLKVWLSVIPVSLTSLEVLVETNKATYTRSINGISKTLTGNACNKLAINMSGATRTPKAEYNWVKRNLSDITSSDIFVIVGNNGSYNYAMNHSSLNSKGAPNATLVTVASNKLSSAPSDALQWKLTNEASGYMFYPADDNTKWLNMTNDNNGLRVSNTAANGKYWSLDTSGYIIGTDTKPQTRYIGVYSSTDWRCYTSITSNISGQSFAFYVRTASGGSSTPTNATVSWTAPSQPGCSISATVGGSAISSGDEVASGATVTITATAGTGYVFNGWTITGATAADASALSTTFTMGDADVTISAAFNNNKGTSENPYTASEAVDVASASGFADTDNVYVKGIVCTTGSISSGAVNYYISDDGSTTKRFEVYKGKYISGADFTDETNLKLGDFVVACGTLTYYSGGSQAEFKQNSQVISVVRAPSFSPADGNFSTTTLSVTITAEAGAQIRYTTDGTDPTTTTGSVYSSAISINASTTIKAIAVKDGFASGVVSKAYTKVGSSSTTATFVFNTDDGIAALGISKPSSSAGTSLAGPYTVDGVTMAVTHGSTDTRIWNSSGTLDLRIYKSGGSLAFTAPSGKSIKNITLAGNAVNGFTASTGTFSSGSWTGSANSVTLTATGTGKINTITVTYE